MIIKLGELKVKTLVDYKDKIVETLERAGFIIVEEIDTTCGKYYTIAIDKVKYLTVNGE